jgi:hypothetical protein
MTWAVARSPIPHDVDRAMRRLQDACTDRQTGRLSAVASETLTSLNRLYRLGNSDKAGEAYVRLVRLLGNVPAEDAREAIHELRFAIERDYETELKEQRGRSA